MKLFSIARSYFPFHKTAPSDDSYVILTKEEINHAKECQKNKKAKNALPLSYRVYNEIKQTLVYVIKEHSLTNYI